MEILTTEQLRIIIEAATPPAVSLFMPTHGQHDTRQDPIELRNLLRQAEEKLIARGMRPTEAQDMLEPARLLVDEAGFWQHNEAGLAIYLAPGFFRAYRVPIVLEEMCEVNDRFEVKPLLPLLESRRFYILCVSDNQVRLIENSPRTWSQVDLPSDVAKTMREAIGGEPAHEGRIVRHAGAATNSFSAGGALHGQGSDIEVANPEDHLFFYRQIDEGVRKSMANEGDTVILAAAESVAPLYRQASSLKNIHADHIHGNTEHVSNEQLHRQGCNLMQPIWHHELIELQDQFGAAISHNLASLDVKEIIPAASMGRVGILFVSTGTTHWGKIIENEVQDADQTQPGAEDLIDRAAAETLMTHGQIVVVKPEDMPGSGELAAIYRY